MRRLTDAQVDNIARRLADRMGSPAAGTAVAPGPARKAAPGQVASIRQGEGVFATVDECIEAARLAFFNLGELTLDSRTRIIAAIREAMLLVGDDLARMAHQETGLGRYEHKCIKNRLVTEKTPGTEALVPEARSGDNGLTLMEWAPFGVIAPITPKGAHSIKVRPWSPVVVSGRRASVPGVFSVTSLFLMHLCS
jgi:acyl-CoA reductase-like NAD-dependent aldehyde dehydrogenase